MSSIINNFSSIKDNHSKMDPLKRLPTDLLIETMFPYFDLASLGAASSTSREWKKIADEPELWKKVLYKEMAFGSDKWGRYCGEDVVKDEDMDKELSSLHPKNVENIKSDFKNFKRKFPEKNIKDVVMLVRIPKTLNGKFSLNTIDQLAREHFAKGNGEYKLINAPFLDLNIRDLSITQSYWMIMTKDVLPGSRDQSCSEQKDLIITLNKEFSSNYFAPDIEEVAVAIFTQELLSKKSLFSNNPLTFTRCQKNQEGDVGSIIIGAFNRINAHAYFQSIDDKACGVAVVRRLH